MASAASIAVMGPGARRCHSGVASQNVPFTGRAAPNTSPGGQSRQKRARGEVLGGAPSALGVRRCGPSDQVGVSAKSRKGTWSPIASKARRPLPDRADGEPRSGETGAGAGRTGAKELEGPPGQRQRQQSATAAGVSVRVSARDQWQRQERGPSSPLQASTLPLRRPITATLRSHRSAILASCARGSCAC